MEQVIAKGPFKKAGPLMTSAECLAIWEEARFAWTHDAANVVAHAEQGRDEAGRELPSYYAGTHKEHGWPCGHRLAEHEIDGQGHVSQAFAKTR
jgi:hypothetical protein